MEKHGDISHVLVAFPTVGAVFGGLDKLRQSGEGSVAVRNPDAAQALNGTVRSCTALDLRLGSNGRLTVGVEAPSVIRTLQALGDNCSEGKGRVTVGTSINESAHLIVQVSKHDDGFAVDEHLDRFALKIL
jgi:hypothetical protein